MTQKLHDNERIKIQSNFLRGNLVEGINDTTTGSFHPDEVQLVKFHGLTVIVELSVSNRNLSRCIRSYCERAFLGGL